VHGTATRNIQNYGKQNIRHSLYSRSYGTRSTSKLPALTHVCFQQQLSATEWIFLNGRTLLQKFVSVGNENHFLCPEVRSAVETISERKGIYLQLAERKSMLTNRCWGLLV
jgi:hypothetical protein